MQTYNPTSGEAEAELGSLECPGEREGERVERDILV